MKRYIALVTVSILSFLAMVSLCSCQKDSPSIFNAAPQVPAKTTTLKQSPKDTLKTTAGFGYAATPRVLNKDFTTFKTQHRGRAKK